MAVSLACIAIYWPIPGFNGKTFKLCVFTRWDFNFCVHSSPLRGPAWGKGPRWWLRTPGTVGRVLGKHFVSGCGAAPQIPTKKSQGPARLARAGVDVMGQFKVIGEWDSQVWLRTTEIQWTGKVKKIGRSSKHTWLYSNPPHPAFKEEPLTVVGSKLRGP